MSSRPEAILTTDRVISALAAALPECADHLDIVEGRLADLTIAPGVRSAGHFRLRFQDRNSGHAFSEGFTVRLRVEGGEDITLTPAMAARYRALGTRKFEMPEVALPGLDAVAHPFPLDVGLPGLLDALDVRLIKDHFKRILKPRGVQVLHLKAAQISYTLGARTTLRYDLRLRDESGQESRETIIGKLNSRKDVAALMADNLALWRKTQGAFSQAEPLGVIQALGLSLQTFVPGTRLTDNMEDGTLADHLCQVGTALARFHNARIPLTKTRDASREQRSLARRCTLLRDVYHDPDRITRLEQQVSAAFGERLRLTGPTHGDFHHANVMVAGDGTVSLIDFDEMGLGDQALDVGRFIVSLSVPSLRVRQDLSLCDLARQTFLTAYRAERAVSDAELGMFEATGWITSAVTAYRLQRPGWADRVDEMIGRAEAAIARTQAADAPDPHASSAAALDLDEITGWLQDTALISLHLKPHVHKSHAAELTDLSVRRVQRRSGAVRVTYNASGADARGKWRGRYTAIAAPGANPRRIKRALTRVEEHLAARGANPSLRLPSISARAQPLGAIFFRTPKGRHLAEHDDPALASLAIPLADGVVSLAAAMCEPVRLRQPLDLVTRPDPTFLAQVTLAAPTPVPGLENIQLADLVVADGVITCVRPDLLVWGPAALLHAQLAHKLAARSRRSAEAFAARIIETTDLTPQIWAAALALTAPRNDPAA